MGDSQKILTLEGISKDFGDTGVLHDLNISIEAGEFITFLGASGCGKTTMLRIIAGLETPSAGRVLLEGADVTDVEPNKRDVNTVFQNYALFPHMNVFDNIAYPLKLRKVKKEEIRSRVAEVLQLVQLEGYERRSPAQLSGGQRQRVAIARAVAGNPKVLLLDEPLGALDLQLRRQMQTELKRLQKQLGITFVYITHDQEEALNMSDKIVVMRDGRVEQIGSPAEIYDSPRTSYVAQFIGTANLLRGTVEKLIGSIAGVRVEGKLIPLSTGDRSLDAGQSVTFAVRGENILLSAKPEDETPLPATVVENHFAGGQMRAILELESGCQVVASRQGKALALAEGQQVFWGFHPADAALVDLEGGEQLH